MNEPVLPRGTEIAISVKIDRIVSNSEDWQIYSTYDKGYILIVYNRDLIKKWNKSGLLPETLFRECKSVSRKFNYLLSDSENIIASIKNGPFPDTFEQAFSFALAIRESRKIEGTCSLKNGIFVEQYSRILPTDFSGNSNDGETMGCYLTGGVELSSDNFKSMSKIVSWMSPEALAEIIKAAGLKTPDPEVISVIEEKKSEHIKQNKTLDNTKVFVLPGRPVLESFFNEHIIDIVLNEEKYRRMGIDFPSALILHGPPGCGKTYAVQKLVEFLGWPSYEMNSGNIGSPYIHDTSKKISEIFDQAIENAPSVIVIDEMEAFLTDRNTVSSSGQHHVEEVAEFLRRIPEAISKKVLIIAMTNMIEKIDPAILRRGRFDNIIAMDMPTKGEVSLLLKSEIKKLPVTDDVSIDAIAMKLAGRAMSDVTYVLKEAGRSAVRQNKECICMEDIEKAIGLLPVEQKEVRKIGF